MQNEKHIACLIVDDEPVAREVIETHLSKIPNITVVGRCGNAIEAFNCLREQAIDLIFLDINMPDISGISFAKSINKNIKIVFTTAYREYAVEGFELRAVDYLLKPISFDRLLKAINTYFETYVNLGQDDAQAANANDFMFVRADRRMVKIDFDAIVYIESFSDYLKIHLANETLVTRETISAIEARLPNKKFLRIHRSFIIALNKISSFNNEEIVIQNTSLSISRSYKKEVLAVLEKF